MRKTLAGIAIIGTACALGLFGGDAKAKKDDHGGKGSEHDVTESLKEDQEHQQDVEDPHAFAEDLDHKEVTGSELEKLEKEHNIDPKAPDAAEQEEKYEEEHPDEKIDPAHPDAGVDVASDKEDPDVIHLHAENFDVTIKTHDFVLVNFYAHKSDPEYEKAAKTLKDMGEKVLMAKVDTTAHSQFAKRFNIDHLPEKKWFVKGKEEDYTGEFNHQGMINWVLKKTNRIAIHVPCAELKAKTTKEKISLVYFGDINNAMYKSFENAPGHPKMTFEYFTSEGTCAPEHGLHPPAIALYRDFDESPIEWQGEGDSGEGTLVEWMNKNAIPHFFELIDDYVETVFGQQESAVYYITNEESRKGHHTPFAEAANALKGKIYFITSGTKGEGVQEHLKELSGLEDSELPMIMVMSPTEFGATKYRMATPAGSATKDQIEKFANDFLANKLTPYHKGAPVPKINPNAPVVEVVRKTWHKIVQNTEKDVFVMFYDPVDPNCLETFPAWKELAEHVANVPDLVIAQIDHTKNEIDRENIEHVPTLKLFPKGKQNAAKHHELEEAPHKHLTAFKRWLKDNSVAYATAFPKEVIPDQISDSDDTMFNEEL